MSNRPVFTKKCISILICSVLMIDFLLLPVLILLTDQNHYIKTESSHSFDDLFSSDNEAFNAKDYIKYYGFSDTEGMNAKDIFSDAQFERVSPYRYGMIMLLYRSKNRLGHLSLVTPLYEIKDQYPEEIIGLSKETGFCSSGFLFLFNNKLYALCYMKGNGTINRPDRSDIKNAIEAFQTPENTDICLFEVKNVTRNLVDDSFEFVHPSVKYYPDILCNLQLSFVYKIVAFIIFVLQYVIVFWVYYLIVKKHRNKKK
ncbi:MAG: hypothetical protein ACI4XE_03730 [Acutalibacteraceae bacterium]